MKSILIIQLTLALGFASVSFGSTEKVQQTETNRKATFPGGTKKMNSWIKENLRTPAKDVRYGIVRVSFTVSKSGTLANFEIVKGLNESMDFAAIQCLQGMPLWEPAIKNGKKVNEQQTIPVQFSSKE